MATENGLTLSGPAPDAPTIDHLPEPSLRLGNRMAVALVDPDPTIRQVLVDHLRTLDIVAVGYETLEPLLDAPNPEAPTVVIIGPSRDPEQVLPDLETLLEKRTSCGGVLLVFDLSPEIVQRAFRSGIDDVVAVHAEDSELRAAVGRASEQVQKRIDEAEKVLRVTTLPVASAPEDVETVTDGRILTVFGTKGGVGKSVVATNLATSLAQQSKGLVALVDANFQFGDAAIMLQLQPTHTVAEAALAGERLDSEMLDDLLLRHKPTGLLVLAAPTEPGAADQIQRADLSRILDVLREMCAYVVVDTSPHLDDATLVALEHADDIIMVAGLEIMSLKNSRVSLQALQVLGIPFSKIKFVLNRTNGHSSLTPADAEKALHMKADVVLPADELMEDSVNRGVPLTVGTPEAKFAKAVRGLVQIVANPNGLIPERSASERVVEEGPTDAGRPADQTEDKADEAGWRRWRPRMRGGAEAGPA